MILHLKESRPPNMLLGRAIYVFELKIFDWVGGDVSSKYEMCADVFYF